MLDFLSMFFLLIISHQTANFVGEGSWPANLWKSQKVKATLKDTHKEASSIKTQALTERSMNMDIWVIGTLNHLFIWASDIQLKYN